MTDVAKKILLLLVTIVVCWLGGIYLKPVFSHYPIIYPLILIAIFLYIAISWAAEIRHKLQSLEAGERKRYLKRNGALALFLVLLVGFASWQMFFR